MTAEQPSELDVGAILQQLRDDIRAQRMAQAHNEPTTLERELRQSLDEIELYRVVSAHWPLKSSSLPGRVLVLLNKVMRRFLRWYINPIVEQQNAYNDAVAQALRLLAEAYDDLKNQESAGHGFADQESARPAERQPAASSTAITAQQDTTSSALQSLVAERARDEPAAQFIELKLSALQPQLALRQHVIAHWPLEGRSALERIAAFTHKLMRQYLRWLINPIVEQQNQANSAISTVIRLLVQLDEQRRAEIAHQRARRSEKS